MKKSSAYTALTFWLLSGFALGGCNLSSLNIPFLDDLNFRLPSMKQSDDIRYLDTSGDDFYAHLAQEYKNLAMIEDDFMGDPTAARHYEVKARTAAAGERIWPDNPTSMNLNEQDAADLSRAYNRVLDALESLQAPDNDALLALAQTRYDCWLERASEKRDESEVSICRDMFHQALGLLKVPPHKHKLFSIFFASDATVLEPQSMETIEMAVASIEERPYWEIVLTGHADSVGDREHNKRLSMRRALAVRNALAQQGADLDKITIISKIAGDRDDDADPRDRRVDITYEPTYILKEGPVYDSLEALGAEDY